MTYPDAVAFWFGRVNFEVQAARPADLKLDRMRRLLRALGDPQDAFRAVHVTGTKGKGSTAAMLDAVLRAAGYRVGLFTSPHLERVEERVRVNGVMISEAEVAAGIAELAPAAREIEPSFFEISTALGFLHFARRRAELAVVEVGLGGRYDSTNVLRPTACVVTSVGMDHVAQLGDTEEKIAFQKAGILKPRTPAVSGVTQHGPRGVVRAVAAELAVPLTELGHGVNFDYTPPHGVTVRTAARAYPPFTLKLPGRHQAANAALVVATVENLRAAGLHIPDAALARGLAEVAWPARVEVVGRSPWRILDSAHNGPSAAALVETLSELVPETAVPKERRRLVFAVSNDKPFREMLAHFADAFGHLHLTVFGANTRSVPAEVLAAAVDAIVPGTPVTLHPTAAEAWHAAVAAGPAGLVCAAGSVFLAGELSAVVRQTAQLPAAAGRL